MRRMKPWLMIAAALGLAAASAQANNLQITNVTVIPKDDTTAFVQFDLSWENSWRYTNINHDAAWVFFKVRQDNHGDLSDWMHGTLEGTGSNPAGYATGSGTPIELIVSADRVGMFVRQSGEGEGTVNVTGIKAVWNFASNGIPKSGQVRVQAFGVEMAFVAEGAFEVGSGGTGIGELYEGGGGKSPFAITNAGPIECGDAVGKLWGASQSGNTSMGGTGTLSNNFPNGYAAFYCMKYEVTQGQYADFLNALTRGQQATRCSATTISNYMSNTASTTSQGRNTVRFTGDPGDPLPRVYTTVSPDRACGWLSWADCAAFAAWAGLRPMTELEFEKACRGPLEAVADEYAWGSVDYTPISGLQGVDGSGSEYYTDGNLIVLNSGPSPAGPVRVGIFATAGSTRVSAGASYWGIMELSGNLLERIVTIGHATGRAFTGLHGNGVLNAVGDADVSGWPGTGSVGSGMRGGSYEISVSSARVSDRSSAVWAAVDRSHGRGWRAARTAPTGVGP